MLGWIREGGEGIPVYLCMENPSVWKKVFGFIPGVEVPTLQEMLDQRVKELWGGKVCRRCGYCMPCPNGVNIPRNFSTFNGGAMYNKWDDARNGYTRWLPEPERASACIQCREAPPAPERPLWRMSAFEWPVAGAYERQVSGALSCFNSRR